MNSFPWSTEARFLVTGIRGVLRAGFEDAPLVVPDNLDWDGLMRMADDHGVLPLLARVLVEFRPGEVPAAVLDRITAYTSSNGIKNRLLTEELFRLTEALEYLGVAAIPYKGPLLAAEAYGDLGMRQFTDLDILVSRSDLPAARTALESLGYRRLEGGPSTTRQERHYLEWECEEEFIGQDGLASVDLHWRLAPKRLPFRIDRLDFWSRGRVVNLNARVCQGLAPEDTLLTLCMHGTKDRWRKLGWVVDVDRLIESQRSLDWQMVLEGARVGRVERALWLGLRLAARLLGTPQRLEATAGNSSPAAIDALADRMAGSLFAPAPAPAWVEASQIEPIHLQCSDVWSDRVRYTLASLFAADARDFDHQRHSELLLPLYRAAHPLRIAFRWVRAVWFGRRARPAEKIDATS